MIRVTVASQKRSGRAEVITLEDGATVQDAFDEQFPHERIRDHVVKRNRETVNPDALLNDLDVLIIAPIDIEGG